MKKPQVISASLILVFFVCLAIVAPLLYAPGPLAVDGSLRFASPQGRFLLGTDEFGRDILSRTAYGIRLSLFIGIVTTALATVFGIVVGLLSGWFRRVDGLISRVLDSIMAFPEIVLAITMSAIWGGGTWNIIFALSFAYFPKMARVVRGVVFDAKSKPYIETGLVAGASPAWLLRYYILPACWSTIVVQATFIFASAVLSEAAMSFLGVGIMEPTPSLGNMVSNGRNVMNLAPWVVLVPGTVIFLMVMAFNLLGDALRDWLDPKLDTK